MSKWHTLCTERNALTITRILIEWASETHPFTLNITRVPIEWAAVTRVLLFINRIVANTTTTTTNMTNLLLHIFAQGGDRVPSNHLPDTSGAMEREELFQILSRDIELTREEASPLTVAKGGVYDCSKAHSYDGGANGGAVAAFDADRVCVRSADTYEGVAGGGGGGVGVPSAYSVYWGTNGTETNVTFYVDLGASNPDILDYDNCNSAKAVDDASHTDPLAWCRFNTTRLLCAVEPILGPRVIARGGTTPINPAMPTQLAWTLTSDAYGADLQSCRFDQWSVFPTSGCDRTAIKISDSVRFAVSAGAVTLLFANVIIVLIFLRVQKGWRSFFGYLWAVAMENRTDTAICAIESVVPVTFTLATVWLLKLVNSILIDPVLSVTTVSDVDRAALISQILFDRHLVLSIALLGLLLVVVNALQYDFVSHVHPPPPHIQSHPHPTLCPARRTHTLH